MSTVTAPMETRADEARMILGWLNEHPAEWGMLLGIAKLEATASAVRAHDAGDTDTCANCGRLSVVRAYNDDARPICGRCARGAK